MAFAFDCALEARHKWRWGHAQLCSCKHAKALYVHVPHHVRDVLGGEILGRVDEGVRMRVQLGSSEAGCAPICISFLHPQYKKPCTVNPPAWTTVRAQQALASGVRVGASAAHMPAERFDMHDMLGHPEAAEHTQQTLPFCCPVHPPMRCWTGAGAAAGPASWTKGARPRPPVKGAHERTSESSRQYTAQFGRVIAAGQLVPSWHGHLLLYEAPMHLLKVSPLPEGHSRSAQAWPAPKRCWTALEQSSLTCCRPCKQYNWGRQLMA